MCYLCMPHGVMQRDAFHRAYVLCLPHSLALSCSLSLQCVAVCCSEMHSTEPMSYACHTLLLCLAVCRSSVSQCVAVCCRSLVQCSRSVGHTHTNTHIQTHTHTHTHTNTHTHTHIHTRTHTHTHTHTHAHAHTHMSSMTPYANSLNLGTPPRMPPALFSCLPIHLSQSVTCARATPPILHVVLLFQERCRTGEIGDTGEEARVFKVQTSFTDW